MTIGAGPCKEVSSLERLRLLLLEEGGLIGGLVDPAARADGHDDHDGRDGRHGAGGDGPAQLASAGPRAAHAPEEYELLVEAIYEGYLLHYHAPRVVRPPEADLGVLAGDRLYALGLDRLVKLGDMEAVAELADVITLTALAHGDGRGELAGAVWRAGARAVGWGACAEHERAKMLVRSGSPEALPALRSLAA